MKIESSFTELREEAATRNDLMKPPVVVVCIRVQSETESLCVLDSIFSPDISFDVSHSRVTTDAAHILHVS